MGKVVDSDSVCRRQKTTQTATNKEEKEEEVCSSCLCAFWRGNFLR